LARLAALRTKADNLCAGTRAIIAEWRQISEMSQALRAAARTFQNEARHVRAQTRLAVENGRQRRRATAHSFADAGDLGAAVGDHLVAQNDNLSAQDNAFGGRDATLV
jgi:hypothetical protein